VKRNKKHEYPAHVIEKIVAWTDEGKSPGWQAKELTKLHVPTARGSWISTNWADYYEPWPVIEMEPWSRSTVVTLQNRYCTEDGRTRLKNAREIAALTPEEKEAYIKQHSHGPIYHDEAMHRSEEEKRILKIAEDPTHPDHEWADPIQLENALIRERERKTAAALQVLGQALGLDVITANFAEPLAWDSEDRKLGREGESKYGGGKGDADNEIARSKLIDWLYRTDKRDLYAVLEKALTGDAQAKREIKYLIRRLAGEAAIQRQANLALVQRLSQADQKAREHQIGMQTMITYRDPRYTTWGQPIYKHDNPRGEG
jgi:hypothetical protein